MVYPELYSDTFSELRANPSLLLLLNAVFLAGKKPMVYPELHSDTLSGLRATNLCSYFLMLNGKEANSQTKSKNFWNILF